MRSLRTPFVAALAAVSVLAYAGTYTIRLVPFPTAEVADGRSQITVSAQVYENGRAAPDGTQVVFETNLGSFRESVVSTSGGWARGALITGGVPGTARIKASVVQGDATGSTCEVEFVKSREELSRARETIEATSTGSLIYANDSKIIEGVAAEKGVIVRYRDLEIHADVLQLDLNDFTLKARKVTVRRGRRTSEYDSLFINLASRTGFGLANYPMSRPETLVAYSGGVAFVEPGVDGADVIAKPRMRFGMVVVGRETDQPLATPLNEDPFELEDISASPSTVGARKAVVYARREIQFHKADIYIDNAKVLRFPLFVVNLNGSSDSPLVTDDLLSVNDNQIALNYPHYLSLKPGLTSLLRFRTGERYGQSLTASRGAFLDYELSWSKGDDMQGGFTFAGVGRSDWVASMRQYWRVSNRTSASFQVDSPSGNSVFGSGSLTHSMPGYNLSLNGSQSQTLTGIKTSFRNYGLSLDRAPARIKGFPLRTTYGLTANQSMTTVPTFKDGKIDGSETRMRSGAGFATRLFTDSIPIDRSSSINGSFSATKLFGPQAYEGVGLNGSISLSRRLGSGASAFATYNYLQDGLNEEVTGRHSVSLVGNLAQGNTNFRVAYNKGIGVDRMSISGEASYRITNVWRLSYSHFFSQYATDSYSEFFYILSYRIGWREVGLTWSNRTNRIGFQLMNVSF